VEHLAGCFLHAIVLLLTFHSINGVAHTPSQTYFTLSVTGTNLSGRWDVALADLHQGMGLDLTQLGQLRAAELQQREEALTLDIAAGVELRADGERLKVTATDYTTLPLNGIEYARLLFEGVGMSRPPSVIEINASTAFRIDTNMHGFLRLEHGGRMEVVAFNEQSPTHRFELEQTSRGWSRWLSFVWEGVWHIWIGFDHLLFLVTLLLPAVLRRKADRWIGVERFRDALLNVLKIVTAFTIAHSITLSIAALDIVRLPSRIVEPVIAASIGLAALNNLLPQLHAKGWLIAFGFGLIHGFGFAGVLVALELTAGTLVSALVGFNVGVEIGQIAIVLAFVPLAFHLRSSSVYTTTTLKYGSIAIVVLAAVWMFQRLVGNS
jgi:hypothetical protein